MPLFPDTPTKLLRTMAEQPVTAEDESAWAQFVELYEPVIRIFASEEAVPPPDVDDVVQDVFLRLVRTLRRDGYDRSRGRFRSYLRTIMRRVLIDRFRRTQAARLDVHTPIDEDEFHASDILPGANAPQLPDAAEMFDERWQKACLNAALEHVFTRSALSDQNREIYKAYVLEGEDAAAVARRFGVTPEVVRQVKSRVNRMIAALVRRMDAE